jgi:TDG/mug DNA glycosylase family protein
MEQRTVDVYEARALEWQAARPARLLDRAEALAGAVEPGAMRLDAGCGPGAHLAALGEPVVGLDAAFAMLEIARQVSPGARCVQADLEHLPVRPGGFGGAWANASYLHVARVRLPWALMELHQSLRAGAPVAMTMRRGSSEGVLAGDDFPGRIFTEWEVEPLTDVLVGAGFSVQECAVDSAVVSRRREWIHVRATRMRTLPDLVGPNLRLLLCGLNPSEYSADVGVGFARPGNRFWPAALSAGIVTRDRDPRHALLEHGVGMTDLVKRASPRADVLTKAEYREGAGRLERLVRWLRPRVVVFVGLSGYRAAIDASATAGEQRGGFGGVSAYVMPNPSGINAHVTADDLAAHLRAAALAAYR